MEIGYNILFSLQLTLGGTVSDSFSILPLADTAASLNNSGLVFKSGQDGSFVAGQYFINDLNTATLLRPLTSTVRFSFLVLLNDPHFFAHTDLQNTGQDTDRVGRRIYYFSNLDTHNTIDGNVNNSQLSLSRTAYVSTADLWSVIPASFGFPVDSTKYTEVELYQAQTGVADKKLTSVYTTGQALAQFILNGHAPGAYQLVWDGTPARTENIYANNDLVKQDFFALIEIYKDTAANDQLLQDKGITYTIPFKQST